MRREMKGFTLMEVVIALVIVAILAAGTLPALSNINKQSFQTEIDLNLPSVGQAVLNGQESATSLYADLADTTTRSVSSLTNELVKYTATVSSKGYTYAIDTLYADVGVGLGSLSSMTAPFQGTSTPITTTTATTDVITSTTYTVSYKLGSDTLLGEQECDAGLNNGLASSDDEPVDGKGFKQINAGNDGKISYSLKFHTPNNYFIIAIPNNTARDISKKTYSWFNFQYKKEENSLKSTCVLANNGNHTPTEPTGTVIKADNDDWGTYWFPLPSGDRNKVNQYEVYPKNENGKQDWLLNLSIKFENGTPTTDQWVRIYIPGADYETFIEEIPATTTQAIITSTTYSPLTQETDKDPVQGMIAWDSIGLDVNDNNTLVTLEVRTISMTTTYTFSAIGPSRVQISLRQYFLPLETLHVSVTASPIDNSKPARLPNVRIYYWLAGP